MADLPNNQKPEEKTIEEKPIEIGSIEDDNLTKKSETPEIQTDKPKPEEEISTTKIKPKEKMPPLPETLTEPEVGTIGNVGNETSQEPPTNTGTPEAQQPKGEENQDKTIDINSIDNFGSKPKKKINIKSLSSILGILIIIAALPITLMLVKQRQEIRKEAASTGLSGSVSFCGITITPTGHNYSNGNYTFSYSITGSGHTVEVHTYGCSCTDGNRGSCGTNSGKCKGNSFTTQTPYSGTITAPNIGDCGTHQADVFVVSVDGRSECHNN